jgi:predicted dehydrogenase
MEKILRVGIIGLGRRWQKRYRPALRALRAFFRVSGVCDQVQERAAREAKRIACTVAAGPTQLLERDDVDAVLLLDTQWFRLWPLEGACRVGKPLFCCCSLEWDDACADALHRQVEESRLPVVMEMAPRSMPVTARLGSLFESELGAPRLLLCEVVRSEKVPLAFRIARMPDLGPVGGLLGGAGIALLDWCAELLGDEPLNVTARSLETIGFRSVFLEFADGRGVQIVRRSLTLPSLPAAGGASSVRGWQGIKHRPTVRLQVQAERGSALVELPNQLSWCTQEGVKSHTLHGQRPLAQLLLVHFHEVVLGNVRPASTLADAYRVLRWLRLAVQSRDEGRLLSL